MLPMHGNTIQGHLEHACFFKPPAPLHTLPVLPTSLLASSHLMMCACSCLPPTLPHTLPTTPLAMASVPTLHTLVFLRV